MWAWIQKVLKGQKNLHFCFENLNKKILESPMKATKNPDKEHFSKTGTKNKTIRGGLGGWRSGNGWTGRGMG